MKVRLINTNDWSFQNVESYEKLLEVEDTAWGSVQWFKRMIFVIYKDS